MPCPCDEQKKKGGGYWRKCEKNVLIELLANLRYQSKYQSTAYIYWFLQQLVFLKVCILEKKKDSGKRLKNCGMRNFREKGAECGISTPPSPSRPCKKRKGCTKMQRKKFRQNTGNKSKNIFITIDFPQFLALFILAELSRAKRSTMGKKMW